MTRISHPTAHPNSLASIIHAILQDIITNEITTQVIQVYNQEQKARQVCSICYTTCRKYHHTAGLDIYGNPPTSPPLIACSRCARSVAANRFAAHLEKCMGLAGRASSRQALQRINGNYSEEDDSDTKRRKRIKPGKTQLSKFKRNQLGSPSTMSDSAVVELKPQQMQRRNSNS